MKKEDVSRPEENTNYYDLKTDAVNSLVDALNEEPKEETISVHKKYIQNKEKEQPNPYKLDKLALIPTWIKAFFIKFWVAGAICYFFIWGLGIYIQATLDMLFVTAFATGIIVDLLVTPAMLYFESDKKEWHPYILVPVPGKKLWSLLINIPVAFLEVGVIFLIYSEINILLVDIKNLPSGSTPLAVEPLLFGLLYLIIDIIIISIKNLFIKVIKKIKNKNK